MMMEDGNKVLEVWLGRQKLWSNRTLGCCGLIPSKGKGGLYKVEGMKEFSEETGRASVKESNEIIWNSHNLSNQTY